MNGVESVAALLTIGSTLSRRLPDLKSIKMMVSTQLAPNNN
jgi:hypothetical protein